MLLTTLEFNTPPLSSTNPPPSLPNAIYNHATQHYKSRSTQGPHPLFGPLTVFIIANNRVLIDLLAAAPTNDHRHAKLDTIAHFHQHTMAEVAPDRLTTIVLAQHLYLICKSHTAYFNT
jgi:hypothetical protein